MHTIALSRSCNQSNTTVILDSNNMCLGTDEWIQLHKLHFFPRKTSRVRVLRLTRKRRAGKDMKIKNLKLYMENISIQEENEKLRKKASLLHQENVGLMNEFQKRFSKCDFAAMNCSITATQEDQERK